MSEHYTSPPETPAPREALLSRRNILQLSLAGLYATTLSSAAIKTWDIAAERTQDHNIVHVQNLPDDTDSAHPHTATLYLPGLKNTWHESHENLKALQPTLRSIGRMASVGYSNLHFDQDEIVDSITSHLHANKIDTVNLYGGSFSGMVATAITPQLVEAGFTVPAIFCDSSPSGPYDVLDQVTFRCMAWAAKHNVSIPEIARLASELTERAQHKNERTVLQIINQSLEQLSPQACSTTMAVSQIGYISNFNLADHADALGDTQMVYLGNAYDVVVNYDTALATWQKTLPHNMQSISYDTGDAYHASPRYGKKEYNAQLRRAIRNLGLIPDARGATMRRSLMK